jgi:hypothetical protein
MSSPEVIDFSIIPPVGWRTDGAILARGQKGKHAENRAMLNLGWSLNKSQQID